LRISVQPCSTLRIPLPSRRCAVCVCVYVHSRKNVWRRACRVMRRGGAADTPTHGHKNMRAVCGSTLTNAHTTRTQTNTPVPGHSLRERCLRSLWCSHKQVQTKRTHTQTHTRSLREPCRSARSATTTTSASSRRMAQILKSSAYIGKSRVHVLRH
jgi:hypothetical protein